MSEQLNTTRRLADFVANTTYADLGEEVIEYTKMIILDTLICGIAAGSMERSRMMHEIVRRQGGVAQASIFGIEGRYPAPLAVMANAEMMNALDADDTFFSSS
ncbi:MAG: MmgE/PrpD family protein, partial [Pseudomonadales bacterium]|nr:MmgE/PrpD family protein [Pseudomonadales bacterium]